MSSTSGPDHEQAKQLVDNFLSNTHDSLKWSWQIVMGFALYTAVQETYLAITATPFRLEEAFHIIIGIFSFIPVFIRFFYGDNRYIDLHYSELRLRIRQSGYEKRFEIKLSKTRRLIDILLLLSQGILFALLGLAIRKPEFYFGFFTGLLVLNCIWLGVSIHMSKRIINMYDNDETAKNSSNNRQVSNHGTRLIEVPERDEASQFWIWNNIVHAGILGVLFAIWHSAHSDGRYIFISILIMFSLSNSILDLLFQRKFYFPELRDLFEDARSK